MDRRTFLKGSGALICYGAFPQRLAFAQGAAAAASKIIDVHCHVFNAKDLPIEDFLQKVILDEALGKLRKKNKTLAKFVDKNEHIPRTLIRVIASVVKAATFGVEAEIKFLGNLPANKFGRDENEIQRHEAALIARIFAIIWDPKRYLIPSIPKRELKAGTEMLTADACDHIRGLIKNELNPTDQALPPVEGVGPPGVADNTRELARQLYYDGDGPLAHMLRWAVKLTRYRIELIGSVKNIYGADQKLVLATPALVDFEKWVYDIPHRKPTLNAPARIEEQVDMLERLSKKAASAQRPLHIHGFVAYDPLRQVLYERLSPANQKKEIEPLELVKRAIGKQGFVGVKLYPPMGFAAIGNKGRSLPDPVTRYYRLDRLAKERGRTIGELLDDALLKLYGWCRDNSVPIMAHANKSNEPYPGYGNKLADPDFWRDLIETTYEKKDFKSLRINLAHFGGFEETIAKWLAGEQGVKPNVSWEWKIGEIRKKHPDAMLFSDISYLNEVLPLPDRQNLEGTLAGQDLKEQQQNAKNILAEVKKHFISFKDSFRKSEDFLLFGSDWLMLGEETGYPDAVVPKQSYGALVRNFLHKEVGYDAAAVDKIMFGNAVRFLGLNAGEGTRTRLEAFYGSPRSDWLKEFDPVA